MVSPGVLLYTGDAAARCAWTENKMSDIYPPSCIGKLKGKSRGEQRIRRQLHLEDLSLVVPQEGDGMIILHSDGHSGQKA